MNRIFAVSMTGLLALALPMPSVAQEGHAACADGGEGVLPAELSGWNERQPLEAGKRENRLASATLEIGKGVDARLARTSEVRYPVRPEKPGGSVSYGGLFTFVVDQPGTYRVALGSGAWVDVLRDKAVIQSATFGRGPECTGVRKMVNFALEPGRYTLMIAANGEPDLPLLVTRLS